MIYRCVDILLVPLTVIIAKYSKFLRKKRFINFPISKVLFLKTGVYPITDHYYEPMFNMKLLKKPLNIERRLPGIDMNIEEQLKILGRFDFNEELLKLPVSPSEKKHDLEYCYSDEAFKSGDAEYLYNMIRLFKPTRIFEIGSGSSTLMAINAINQNKIEDPKYKCQHICIEPFENYWLESIGIQIHRKLVEDMDISFFTQLGSGDILFIDSSHIIRPQGDVLFEYLEILPTLNAGVIIHIHDIFTPRDYLREWMEIPYFWNEQYLLEAFLTNNRDFRIIGATNYLRHNYYDAFSNKCPVLKKQIEIGIERDPGSFWLIKNK